MYKLLVVLFFITCCLTDDHDNTCKGYDSDGNCNKCSLGYYLSMDTCHQDSSACQKDNGSDRCLQCNPQYRLLDTGTCSFHFYCMKWNGDRCQQCLSGWDQYCRDPNCVEFDDHGKCLQCKDGMLLFEETCIHEIENCMEYGGQGICYFCRLGFQLMNGQCVDPNCVESEHGKCLQCKDGMLLFQETCIHEIENCMDYGGQGICYSCYPGFNLMDGHCVEAKRDPDCVEFDDHGRCLQCKDGMVLFQESTCIHEIENCMLYGGQGICSICRPGFILMYQYCVPL